MWRPIIVDLRVLFPIIDDKRTLEKDRSLKKGAGLDDAQLGRSACDYLMSRLKPSNGKQPLPPWFQRGASGAASADPFDTASPSATAAEEKLSGVENGSHACLEGAGVSEGGGECGGNVS